ncbi:MAG TPA: hypothetical protein VIL86_16805, partial [Tepidisphaeraceae bacterium]|jgi:glutamine synthetase
VYTERELHSRYAIFAENYVKTVNIEGQLTSLMARTQILPAALRYQTEVAGAIAATKAAGVEVGGELELLKNLTHTIGELQKAIVHLDKALSHHAEGDPYHHAKHSRDEIIPAQNAVRGLGDKLEMVVADDLWPLPTYREMLFIR